MSEKEAQVDTLYNDRCEQVPQFKRNMVVTIFNCFIVILPILGVYLSFKAYSATLTIENKILCNSSYWKILTYSPIWTVYHIIQGALNGSLILCVAIRLTFFNTNNAEWPFIIALSALGCINGSLGLFHRISPSILHVFRFRNLTVIIYSMWFMAISISVYFKAPFAHRLLALQKESNLHAVSSV